MFNFYKINGYIYNKISNKNLFINQKSQEKILEEVYKESFQENYFSRSYCQYLCQKKLYKQNYIFLNFISFFFIKLILLFFKIFSKKIIKEEKVKVLYFGIEKTIPKEFLNYERKKLENHLFLTKKDIEYFENDILKKSKKEYYFALKVLLKMAIYRYNIEKYSPEIFLVTSEYSWTSSILTEFCEKNKILHINYMHGNKWYVIRDSFFKFHKCYVWDEHYAEIFCELKAFEGQFEVIDYLDFIPQINIEIKELYNTYYLQIDETENELEQIIAILEKLRLKTGYKGKIRCHPVYTPKKIKNKIPKEMLDEEKNIYHSIVKSNYLISKYSTVLYEAFVMKKGTVVIDDITKGIEKYNSLKELGWISGYKPHLMLSEIIKEDSI
ncbi:hypothetical protein [Fusobacterium animalis]|uniref:hypothetical protein n=1 Tax=Fusobacterium animalis TaxID=76859 RepID=UPI0030CFCAD7